METTDEQETTRFEGGGGPLKFDPLRFKVEGITDRDAPSLYGTVGDRDLFKLWADKVDLEDSAQAPGLNLFEATALDAFQVLLTKGLRSCYAQSKTMPFLRALLDAFDPTGGILARVVSLSREAFQRVDDAEAPVRGRVPEQNWVELQHQMLVVGLREAFFVATVDGSQIKTVVVERDDVFTSNHVAECVLFWDCVRRGEPPKNAVIPPDVDRDQGPGEEDGPWAEGWVERSGQIPLSTEEEHA